MNNIYLETLGCSKNQVDSEKMLFLLENAGYNITNNPEEAEIIIINTCCFIRPAKEEAIETILNLSKYKNTGFCKKLIVAGCLSQYYSKILKEEIPEIDIIFGVGDISNIVDAVKKENDVIIKDYQIDNIDQRKFLGYPGTAYLKISDGCSNYCSYCIIPFIRGTIRSKTIDSLIKEIEFFKQNNIKEIILIAQDTTNYGIDNYNKRSIVELISTIDKLIDASSTWLRVLYMHPDHLDENILKSLKTVESFIPYFDIPFQSGSNKILKLMNRNGTQEKYLDLIDKIKNIFNNPVIRSSFITGFPGETENDFNDTINFIEKAQLDWVGGFKYSREDNTAAAVFKKHVNEKIKKERLDILYKTQDKITAKRLERFIGTTQKILLEERVENEDLFIGRFYGQAPDVDGLTVVDLTGSTPGNFIQANIKRLNDKDFFAVSE